MELPSVQRRERTASATGHFAPPLANVPHTLSLRSTSILQYAMARTSSPSFSYQHLFEPGSDPSAAPLLLLHGTGGSVSAASNTFQP